MLLKKIVFEQDPFFGNTVFDFCDSEGKPYKTIILAGENGTGKSSLLNVIYNLFMNFIPTIAENKHATFVLELSEQEVLILKNNNAFKTRVAGYEIGNELTLKVNHSVLGSWSALTVTITRKDVGEPLSLDSYLLSESDIRPLFKTIYSDVG